MENKTTEILQIGLGNAHILRKATLLANPGRQMKIDYHHVKSRLFGGGVEMVANLALKNLGKYDIVHNLTQHPFFPRNRDKITLITTAHELQEVQFPEFTPMATATIKSRLWRYTITLPGIRCLLDSDYTTATSQLIRDGLAKAGFPKKRIFMTPLGMEKSFISSKRSPQPRSDKTFKIGTIGTIGPQKNTFFAIDAVKGLEDDSVAFEIWGKSVYTKNQLNDRINEDSRIKLQGYVPEAKKASVYDSFDVFVFPSLFEGFGIPIIEAKARGVPVILFKDGRISPEVREHCLEAKSPEHMAEFIQKIKDNGYDPKLRRKAIQSARKFTLERTGQSILKAYETVSG